MNIETILFENNTLKIINQTKLPRVLEYLYLTNLEEVIYSIKNLQVRGAPAIGIVAAYGFYIHTKNLFAKRQFSESALMGAAEKLKHVRPTAVNLQWAVNKMIQSYKQLNASDEPRIINCLKTTAINIHKNDKDACSAIGHHGSGLISDSMNILTHCNAGILATGGMGTALAPIYTAFNSGKKIHVYVDETRPIGQGARLTYWELLQNKIPATLITDNMAASLMNAKRIDLIIVGADRIARNGDVANKIGTYGLAVLADFHNIPFYVAAPVSTIDYEIMCGNDIPIEERSSSEITRFWDIDDSADYNVYNPAFDITPNHLITAIITNKGIIMKPIENNLKFII